LFAYDVDNDRLLSYKIPVPKNPSNGSVKT
jgi:hypothetical protein